MAKGEIIIKESNCRGCGYCEEFCKPGCITMCEDKVSPLGFILPVFSTPDNCNACGVCGMMCPHFAIEVYKFIESEAAEG